nr:MAG TPA: hypothetical protein [Caudoviricetes sp.]
MLTELKEFWKNTKTYDFNDYINRDPDFVEIEVAEHKPPTKKQRVAYGSLFLITLIIIDTLSYLNSSVSITVILCNVLFIVLLISTVTLKSITIGKIIKDDEYTLKLSKDEKRIYAKTPHDTYPCRISIIRRRPESLPREVKFMGRTVVQEPIIEDLDDVIYKESCEYLTILDEDDKFYYCTHIDSEQVDIDIQNALRSEKRGERIVGTIAKNISDGGIDLKPFLLEKSKVER